MQDLCDELLSDLSSETRLTGSGTLVQRTSLVKPRTFICKRFLNDHFMKAKE
jgi:hypothetical protein